MQDADFTISILQLLTILPEEVCQHHSIHVQIHIAIHVHSAIHSALIHVVYNNERVIL